MSFFAGGIVALVHQTGPDSISLLQARHVPDSTPGEQSGKQSGEPLGREAGRGAGRQFSSSIGLAKRLDVFGVIMVIPILCASPASPIRHCQASLTERT